jgi:hypothetical protein
VVNDLALYDTACRAVAAARTIDEAKDICDRSAAARAYAKQIKNKQMEIDALEIRVRAERRLGELILELKAEGVGVRGRRADPSQSKWSERPFLRLSDIGIDGATSALTQRLALLPVERFDTELARWRAAAPSERVLQPPLQTYRDPHAKNAAVTPRRGKPLTIDAADTFAPYRAPDGRRIADWRFGELERQAAAAARILRCIAAVKKAMPVVEDPLATLEMVFKPSELLAILKSEWDALPINRTLPTGLQGGYRPGAGRKPTAADDPAKIIQQGAADV